MLKTGLFIEKSRYFQSFSEVLSFLQPDARFAGKRRSYFRPSQDASYSGKHYATEEVRYSDWDASYCPDCVREDLESFGFSYWKRFCTRYVKVCYKHNVVLLNHCPFCSKPFSRKGHTLDVMWRKCDGKHLAEAPSLRNENLSELKRAITLHGLCSSSHHICDEVALCVLLEKAASLISIMPTARAAEMESELQRICRL